MVAKFLDLNNRELKQRGWQREQLKSNKFISAKQQLCMRITLFVHFSAAMERLRHELPNFTSPLYGVTQFKNFLFLNLNTLSSDSTPENLTN